MHERRFLVISPTGRLRRIAERIQAELSRRHELYSRFPPPVHVTIEHFTPSNVRQREKAVRLIRRVARTTRPFYLHVDGFSAFPAPVRAVNLHVVETPPLRTLSERVHDALGACRIEARDSLSDWRFHLTLASTTFAASPWSDAEFVEAFRRVQRRCDVRASCRVDELQLWAPKFNPRPVVLARFPLKARRNLARSDWRRRPHHFAAAGAGARRPE